MRTLLIVLLLSLAGCYVGPRGEMQALATEPRGARITVRTGAIEVGGELLAVLEDAIVVRTTGPDRILQVPLRQVSRLQVEMAGSSLDGRFIRSRDLERLRRVSRFPQGLTPELRDRLVAAYGVPGVEVLEQ
jgi:hypothetical protein